LNDGSTSGFTLLEMAIVLILVSLLLLMSVRFLDVILRDREERYTETKLTVLQHAINEYRRTFDRLPCPADLTQDSGAMYFGVEAYSTVDELDCVSGTPGANHSDGATAVGMVPTRTLQLPDEYAFDGWGRRILYAVDLRLAERYSNGEAFGRNPITTTPEYITVTSPIASGGGVRTSDAAYVLLSFGANGHGAFSRAGVGPIVSGTPTSEELTNCACDASGAPVHLPKLAFVQGTAGQSSGMTDAMDDIVIFVTRSQLATGRE
jgi:prepilin-type N-terminal cleavage/methylation domain-containing protein